MPGIGAMLIAEFVIDGPIKPKQRPRHGQGRTFTPQATLDSEELIAWAFRARRRFYDTHDKVWPVPANYRLRLEVDYRMPDKRGRDWDNIGKTVADALNKIAYHDDSQIREAEVVLRDPAPGAKTGATVRIYFLGSST